MTDWGQTPGQNQMSHLSAMKTQNLTMAISNIFVGIILTTHDCQLMSFAGCLPLLLLWSVIHACILRRGRIDCRISQVSSRGSWSIACFHLGDVGDERLILYTDCFAVCVSHGNIIKHQHVSHMTYGICDWYMALTCYPCGKGICESYMVSLYLSVPFFTWGSYGNSI
jgi:hypothetical protein